MVNRFDGQTVIVTGAASGIGFEMARQFHDEGATVYAADLHPDGVPDGTRPLYVDVADPAGIEAMTLRAVAETGRLDVMCNNAGASSVSDPLSCTVEDWDRTFAVNARGVFLGTKYALPPMLGQGRGAIVNTASVAGQVGLKDRAAYCASKGAVIAFTRQVAVQYAGTGVRANCVCPGLVDTPSSRRSRARMTPAELAALPPILTPADIADAAMTFLADDTLAGRVMVCHGGAPGRLLPLIDWQTA